MYCKYMYLVYVFFMYDIRYIMYFHLLYLEIGPFHSQHSRYSEFQDHCHCSKLKRFPMGTVKFCMKFYDLVDHHLTNNTFNVENTFYHILLHPTVFCSIFAPLVFWSIFLVNTIVYGVCMRVCMALKKTPLCLEHKKTNV